MPTSTAETVTRASSPGARPATVIGIAIGSRGFASGGRVEGDVELARVAADGEPGEPDRAAGHAPAP